MSDVLHDEGQQPAQGACHDRSMKVCMPQARTDRQDATRHRHLFKCAHAIDVDEMRRPRHTKSHRRYQTLAARYDAAIVRCELAEQLHSLLDCLRCVILERRWFHGLLDRHAPAQVMAEAAHCVTGTIIIFVKL